AGIYSAALSLIRGELSRDQHELLNEPRTYEMVSRIANEIKLKGSAFTEQDISLRLGDQAKLNHWRSVSKVSAFLKHADRDPDDLLPLDEMDNEKILMHACAA